MSRVVLLLSVLLLIAGVAWSQGGAGGGDEPAVETAGPVAVPAPTQPLTLQGRVPSAASEAQRAPPAGVAVDDTACIEECVEVENPPPDPVETGVSTLIVTLSDEQGVTPARRIDLELWRLGAPANEHWLEGDQLQVRAEVEGGRVEWAGLPEGRYRLFTGDARVGAEDPSAFHVGGALTVIEASLALPRRVPVLVQVFDENGLPLRAGKLRAFGGSRIGSDAEPAWRQERKLRHGVAATYVTMCCGCCGGGGKSRAVQAGDTGFDLGSCREAARSHSWSSTEELDFDGRTSVTAYVDGDDVRFQGPTRYVAVSVPLRSITDHVWTADGRRALEAGARFEARCKAARITPDAPSPEPSTLLIEVSVRLFEHEPLTFTTCPCERPIERTLLRATRPEPAAR